MNNKAKQIIICVAMLLVVMLLAGSLIAFFTKGKGRDYFDELSGSFYVSYEDKVYKPGEVNTVALPCSGEAEFTIKNANNVSVHIVPNANIVYKVNGETKNFLDIGDLTKYFIEQDNVYSDHFIIECVEDKFAIEAILHAVYGENAELELPSSHELYLYKMLFACDDQIVEVLMYQGAVGTGIELNRDEIVF